MKKQSKSKKRQSGFTLIELLAVITIMGILLLVSIPAVSTIINNTRRDTFKDTAQQYINATSNLWLSDNLYCQQEAGASKPYDTLPANVGEGDYYILIDTTVEDTEATKNGVKYYYPKLLEKGGKSSWANAHIGGFVRVHIEGNAGDTERKVSYFIRIADDGHHGISDETGVLGEAENTLSRASILTKGVSKPAPSTDLKYCKEY